MPVETRSTSSRRDENEEAASHEEEASGTTTSATETSGTTTTQTTEQTETTTSTVADNVQPVPSAVESPRIVYLRAQLEEARLRTELARAIYEEEQAADGNAATAIARVEDWMQSARPTHTDRQPEPLAITEVVAFAPHNLRSAATRPQYEEAARPHYEEAATRLHNEEATQASQKEVSAGHESPALREVAQAPQSLKDTSPALLAGKSARALRPAEDEVSAVEEAKISSHLENTAPKQESGALKAADITALASALAEVSRGAPRYNMELPTFDGAGEEWLQFKAAYRDTEKYFGKTENRARIRRCLRGNAKDAVACMFYGETDPSKIVDHLEIQFGRPDALVSAELEKIKALPRVKESARETCVFASKVNNIVATIRALNRESYLHDTVAVNSLLAKFNYTLQHSWFQYARREERRPDLQMICEFLMKEAEMCAALVPHENTRENQQVFKKIQRTHTQNYEPPVKKDRCAICQDAHTSSICEQFSKASVDDRWAMAKRNSLCFRCLQKRRPNHECRFRQCGIDGCKGSHHRRLHNSRTNKKTPEEPTSEGDAVVMSALSSAPRAYLKVVPIVLTGSEGSVNTYALLDEGSTVTLIEEKVAAKIGARGPVEPFRIETVGGARLSAERSRRIAVTIQGLHHHQRHRVIGRTIGNLNLSPQSVSRAIVNQCRHLEEIEEDVIMERAVPTVLIGQDNWHLIVTRAVRSGRRGQPVASLTHLGWVLHGVDFRHKQRVHLVQRAVYAEQDEDIEKVIRNYFDLDSVGITPRQPIDKNEQRALQILEETCKRLPDGRYEAGLLWREDSREVPDSRGLAMKRLVNTERRLDKDPALKEAYEKQVQHLLDSGYAEPANELPGADSWYLPHFAVVNPAKPKPRIVYDAAARVQGVSLNDMLLAGPDLLQNLPGVLMRFRQLPIAVTADIKEMFLQIRIRQEDRDALRFLWRGNDRKNSPREYRMTSVVFGAASSPSTAIYVKNKNAQEHAHLYPDAATAVVRNHYMDDYLQSFDNAKDAATIASQVSLIHQQAHFQLRGWKSNDPAVAKTLLVTPSMDSDWELNQEGEKVLGLKWKPYNDKLGFNVKAVKNEETTPTKRHALRVAMSIFDPLGLITPVTIHAKHLLQETWRIGLPWDEPLPADLEKTWRSWLHDVRRMEDLEIPRAHSNMARARDRQLHIFTDASESAYAAAAYWRIVGEDGEISVSLAAAKGRVSPLKFTSIPRLEIQAALLGARLAQHVMEEYDYQPSSRVYWTDSRTVLSWLRTGSRAFKPFVAHRVAEIEDITKVAEWRWVPSKENVADDATRQIPINFDDRHRWFVGPAFLYLSEENWPPDVATSSEITYEEKTTAAVNIVNNVVNCVCIAEALPDATRFSSWLRLVRAAARVLQFTELCRRTRGCAASVRKRTSPNSSGDDDWKRKLTKSSKKSEENTKPRKSQTERRYLPLEGADLNRAEKMLIRASQAQSFPSEMKAITGGSAVARDSRLKQLSLITDEDGLLRIKSRIAAAEDISDDLRVPAVLDGRHPYTRLYIQHVHRRLHHSGVEATVNEVLQKFWVIRLRPTVRSIVKSCALCRKRSAIPPQPPTGDLPKSRVAHHQRAFTYVGLDYLGPLSVTIGRRHEKRYVALFTCLTSRAVHLEMAATLTTDSAVMALRRMMSRRGCPTEVWSDNGTNFRGADAELRRAALEATKEAAVNYTVQWKFIPPGAPFMGGAWERMVRSVKTALFAVLQQRHPPEEILHTLLVEVEHTLNSRPLTHVSVSPEDPAPLTPNHFLLGGPSRVPIPGAFSEGDTIGRRQWRHSQQLANSFWSRWVREALPLLQKRREPTGRGAELRVGDIVLIADGALPRNTWPTGIIEAVHPGADGVVRVADVRTAAGVMRRPTKKLVWLHHS